MFLVILLTALAVAFGIGSWWLLRSSKIKTHHWSVAAASLLWLVGIGVKAYVENIDATASSALIANSLPPVESIAWPGNPDPAPLITQSSVTEAAPIASLIGGLESRLAEQPEDAKGWALLAQSYAFVGNTEAADRTLQRAVELGLDEQALQDRVKLAGRESQPVDWIEAAITAQ